MSHNMGANIIRWAKVTTAATPGESFAVQQVSYSGKTAKAQIIFPYGMHGNVPPDSLALIFAIQGNADNRAAIAFNHAVRPDLEEGEVALYHPASGSFIIHRSNGDLDIESANVNVKTELVNIECTTMTLDGDLEVNGDITQTGNLDITGTMTNNGKDVGDTHGHAQAPDSDGNGQAPISGVT